MKYIKSFDGIWKMYVQARCSTALSETITKQTGSVKHSHKARRNIMQTCVTHICTCKYRGKALYSHVSGYFTPQTRNIG